ncbi:hypothetical protein E2C01_042867 [Portunus trituberculatus]|uniref:Death domain-containing protein n=1 Tax=Portunus trituberculatus TaxID=210409 RepID=A0A5B7FU54_PORTR|nr:hypothetical protein [Portunus trituberculatus]
MPDVSQVGMELKEEVEELLKEEKERTFPWLEKFDINIWKFRAMNPVVMRSLEDEMDISEWQPIAESLGLNNAQIQRCQRSGTFTRAVFNTMEEYPQFQHLTVKRFLEILIHHNRRDILSKMEEFARLSESLQHFDLWTRGAVRSHQAYTWHFLY